MDGRTLKVLNVVDEISRDCLAIRMGRWCRTVDEVNTIEAAAFPPTRIAPGPMKGSTSAWQIRFMVDPPGDGGVPARTELVQKL